MALFDQRLGLAIALSCALAACAAPSIPDTLQDLDDTEGEPVVAKKPATPSKTGGTTSGTPSDGERTEPAPKEGEGTPTPAPAPGGACTSSTSADACYQCCDPSDAVFPAVQAFGDCACGSPGVCAAACGTSYCAGQAPTAACEACLNGATQCETQADAACGAACKAAMQCVETSKCDEKP